MVKRSGRLYLRSLVVGEFFTQLLDSDRGLCTWHLDGHQKSTPEVRRYFAVASCSAAACDDVLQALGTDNRFLRFAGEYH